MKKPGDKDKSLRETKFVQRTFRMGPSPELLQDKVLVAADAMEDEEILRKLVRDRFTRT